MQKILIVDDDALASELTGAILEMNGYEVLLAEHGLAALDLIEQHPDLSLIISDMNMPMMNGIELFETLATLRIVKFFPFINFCDEPRPFSVISALNYMHEVFCAFFSQPSDR